MRRKVNLSKDGTFETLDEWAKLLNLFINFNSIQCGIRFLATKSFRRSLSKKYEFMNEGKSQAPRKPEEYTKFLEKHKWAAKHF